MMRGDGEVFRCIWHKDYTIVRMEGSTSELTRIIRECWQAGEASAMIQDASASGIKVEVNDPGIEQGPRHAEQESKDDSANASAAIATSMQAEADREATPAHAACSDCTGPWSSRINASLVDFLLSGAHSEDAASIAASYNSAQSQLAEASATTAQDSGADAGEPIERKGGKPSGKAGKGGKAAEAAAAAAAEEADAKAKAESQEREKAIARQAAEREQAVATAACDTRVPWADAILAPDAARQTAAVAAALGLAAPSLPLPAPMPPTLPAAGARWGAAEHPGWMSGAAQPVAPSGTMIEDHSRQPLPRRALVTHSIADAAVAVIRASQAAGCRREVAVVGLRLALAAIEDLIGAAQPACGTREQAAAAVQRAGEAMRNRIARRLALHGVQRSREQARRVRAARLAGEEASLAVVGVTSDAGSGAVASGSSAFGAGGQDGSADGSGSGSAGGRGGDGKAEKKYQDDEEDDQEEEEKQIEALLRSREAELLRSSREAEQAKGEADADADAHAAAEAHPATDGSTQPESAPPDDKERQSEQTKEQVLPIAPKEADLLARLITEQVLRSGRLWLAAEAAAREEQAREQRMAPPARRPTDPRDLPGVGAGVTIAPIELRHVIRTVERPLPPRPLAEAKSKSSE